MSIEKLKQATPWFVKIPAKIILSRLPVGWRRWQRLNLFRAGAMDTPEYAFNTFKKHFEASGLTSLGGCTVLELGPGNSLLTALYAHVWGATKSWLVDSEPLASEDTSIFTRAERMLSECNLPAAGVEAAPSLNAVLEKLNATYLTQGLTSLRSIPDQEIDFFFSNAVLEHVRLAEFADLAKEMRRVLKPAGVASHQIDFRDHLQNGLNNLRFSTRTWESEFMARSGFYTNRLTWPAMKKLFEEAGFAVELVSAERWSDHLPTPQSSMAIPFRNLPAEELMVMSAHAVLRPRV